MIKLLKVITMLEPWIVFLILGLATGDFQGAFRITSGALMVLYVPAMGLLLTRWVPK